MLKTWDVGAKDEGEGRRGQGKEESRLSSPLTICDGCEVERVKTLGCTDVNRHGDFGVESNFRWDLDNSKTSTSLAKFFVLRRLGRGGGVLPPGARKKRSAPSGDDASPSYNSQRCLKTGELYRSTPTNRSLNNNAKKPRRDLYSNKHTNMNNSSSSGDSEEEEANGVVWRKWQRDCVAQRLVVGNELLSATQEALDLDASSITDKVRTKAKDMTYEQWDALVVASS
ncbi:hypothetical protein BJ878DRAFT_579063 [Calycina marina]|uniref:Uncharacterized protein n=1 Tax=Calycina marina TaxID=1763456 RepID=A0A9P8CBC3_9HELO|nr:hypothetical protein BJ878DRAFT_579063 [Calycina marina]